MSENQKVRKCQGDVLARTAYRDEVSAHACLQPEVTVAHGKSATTMHRGHAQKAVFWWAIHSSANSGGPNQM
jgi:hypothetical protein